jgi:cell division protein FtsW
MEALRFPWASDDGRSRSASGGGSRRGGQAQVPRRAPAPAPAKGPAQTTLPFGPPPVIPRRVRPARVAPAALGEAAHDPAAGRVVRGPVRERHEPDYLVLVAAAALAAVGLLMITSSRGVESALRNDGDVFAAVTQQVAGLLGGILALVLLMRTDYRHLRLVSVPGYALALLLLVLVLLPAMGPIQPIEVGNAARWLKIGGLPSFHPAEIAKLALVIYLAHWLASQGSRVGSLFHGMVPFLLIVGPAIVLVALEPDLGTTGVFTLTAFTMFFVAGGSIWQLALLVPAGVAAVALYVRGYQMQRIETWLDPWAVASGEGYQTVQGLLALAMGGLFGTGLGQSAHPGAVNVPNADNDFIFAVVGQELGMVGALVLIGLVLVLGWRGIRIALAAPDTFGGLLALGITTWLVLQAFINIGVVTSLLPLTGIPLPFVSAGATSLVVSFAAIGILLSISRETIHRGTSKHADPDRGGGNGRPHLPRPGRPARAG